MIKSIPLQAIFTTLCLAQVVEVGVFRIGGTDWMFGVDAASVMHHTQLLCTWMALHHH